MTHRHPAPSRAGLLTAGWATLSGMAALVWLSTGRGVPFGAADPDADANLLRAVPPDVGAEVSAAVLLSTAVAAFAMTGPAAVRLRGLPRAALLTFCWTVVAVLLVVVPDSRLLALLGYAPLLIIGAPFGWFDVDYAAVLTWPLAHQVWCLAGGVLLARTVLAWQRRTAGVCGSCGRDPGGSGWTARASATRWGRWAAWTAAVIPLFYAVTRLAWAVGIPLGVSESFMRTLRDTGGVWAATGLGAFAVIGAVLTLGLVQHWGEVFPRWIPGLAGRRVPVNLAFVPAMLVAVLAASAGVGFLSTPALLDMTGGWNLASLPVLLWPLWGVALGAAAIAYRLRRRGPCTDCGAGDGPGQLASQMAALSAVAKVTQAQ
jgi:hypothetical protein